MPLSPIEKEEYVKLQGFDPKQYTVDDNTVEIVPLQNAPSASNPLAITSAPAKYGKAETFGRNAALGVGPAAVGLGSGVLAGFGAGALTGAITGAPANAVPLAGQVFNVLTALGGGIAGAYGASKLQEKVLSTTEGGRKFTADTAAASAENPVSAVGGNLAAQLPFLRPSPMMMRDLAKSFYAGGKLPLSQIARSPAGMNIGIGTGIGAGAGLYDEYADPNDFNAARFGLNVLGGAALHQPTRVSSRYLGVQPYSTPVGQKGYTGDVRMPSDVTASPRNRFTVDESGAVMDKSKAGVQAVEEALASTRNPRAEDFQKARVEEVVQAVKENPEAVIRAVTGQATEIPKPRVVTNDGTEIYNDYSGNQEVDMMANEAESAADLEMRQLEGHSRDRYQDAEQNHATEQVKTRLKNEEKQLTYEELKLQKETNQLRAQKLKAAKAQLEADRSALQSGKSLEFTRQPSEVQNPKQQQGNLPLRDLNTARAAQHSGIDFAYEPGRTITTPDGKSVFGYAEGQNKVRATETKADTVPHEIAGHILHDELPASQRARMQKVMESDPVVRRWIAGEKAAGRNPGNGVVTPEAEYLAQRAGEMDIDRILKRDDDLAKSATAWWRSNFGSPKATTDDFARWLTQRFTHGRTSRGAGDAPVVRTAGMEQSGNEQSGEKSPFQKMREEVIGRDTPQPTREELASGAEKDRVRNLDMRRYSEEGQKETHYAQPSRDLAANTDLPALESEIAAVRKQIAEYPKLDVKNSTDAQKKEWLDAKSKLSLRAYNLDEAIKIKGGGKATLQEEGQEPTLFYNEAPRVLAGEKGAAPSEQLWNRVKNKITPAEAEMYEAAGVKEYVAANPRVTGDEMSKWLEANGPKVDVVEYGMEGKVSKVKAEHDKMTHEWAEQLTDEKFDEYNHFVNKLKSEAEMRVLGWSTEELNKAKRYNELKFQLMNEQPSAGGPRATSAYDTVSAFPTNEPMPDWTKSKSDKNVQRVDVVIPSKKNYTRNSKGEVEYAGRDETLWQPDNLHENLPNTLGWAMIQYKTGPKGEKIAVVAEAQSRWGQEVRKHEQDLKEQEKSLGRKVTEKEREEYLASVVNGQGGIQDHPLLKDYNRLILKAAIDQAKKEGAEYVMISDGETAMMTEGHDNYGGQEQITSNGQVKWEPLQASGMRLNYDKILPQIMKDLTGVSGEKVSLGEHKNAMYKSEYGSDIPTVTKPRPNLIFRNPDGTPKTDVSGRLYPISSENTPSRYTLTRARYSDSEQSSTTQTDTPEFKKWFGDSKVVDAEGKPLVVYHGTNTPKEFSIFNTDKNSQFNELTGRLGSFFGDIKVADEFVNPDGIGYKNRVEQKARIYSAHLSLSNPFEAGSLKNLISTIRNDFNSKPELFKKHLKEQGFDGIVYDEFIRGKGGAGKSYIAFYPTQIKSATGNRGTFDPTDPDIRHSDTTQSPTTEPLTYDPSKRGFLRALTGQFDQVATVSKPLSEAMKNAEQRAENYIGWGQEFTQNISKFDEAEVADVMSRMRTGFRDGETSLADIGLSDNPIAQEFKKLFYSRFGAKRRELGMKIDGRDASMNELYIPDQLSDKSLDLFTRRATSPEARAAKNEWATFISEHAGVSREKALADVNDYINALGSESSNYLSVNFGALRRAQGFGLPESLRELNPIANTQKYVRRASKDMAFFGEMENKPEIRNLLKLKNPETGKVDEIEGRDEAIPQSPIVRDAMKTILGNTGSNSGINPVFNSFARFVNSGILGPATGVRDVVGIVPNMIPYVQRLSDFGALAKGMAQFRQESGNALLTAAKKPNLDKLVFGDILEAPDKVSAMFNQGATLLRKYQGREALENFGRDVTFAMGKELARNNIMMARAGDRGAKKFLEKFGRLVEGDITTKTGEELEVGLNQMAKNLTDRVQGSYGGRGLPTWTMEGGLSPFLSLQKWGIEKSNVIYQDVYKPFITGENYMPMFTYLFGSVMTGAAIQELNKLMTGRKPQDADIKETLSKATAKNVAAELATLMQLGSFAGIMSDGLKFVSDVGLKGKTPRNIVSFPAATTVADVGEKLADYSEAIQQGTDPWLATKMFAMDMFTHNIQAARMLANQTVKNADTERTDKFRDLRVYRELTGAPSGEPTKSNKYLDAESREFKRTGDISEAAGMLPALLGKFGEKVKENPAKAMRFLAGLKANNYQTMPAPGANTEEFVEFYQFLVDTQGREAAGERFEDYIRQNAVNKAKASLVP